MHWTRLTLALIAAGLAGCASSGPSSVLAEGPRMIDLYRGTAAEQATGRNASREDAPKSRRSWWPFNRWCRAPAAGSGSSGQSEGKDAAAYTRNVANELELLFPRLPNPDIYIHVLPHLATDERVPVPGYTTAVPLYERVEYALPGETARPGPASAEAAGTKPGGASVGAGDAGLASEGAP